MSFIIWVVESGAVGSNPRKPFDVAAAAIRALVVVAPEDERLPHRFLTWLGAADEDAKLAAVTGFPKLETSKKSKQDAIMGLIKILKVEVDSPKMKVAAADALGEFGPEASVAERALEAATADRHEEVRRSAKRALGKIRGE